MRRKAEGSLTTAKRARPRLTVTTGFSKCSCVQASSGLVHSALMSSIGPGGSRRGRGAGGRSGSGSNYNLMPRDQERLELNASKVTREFRSGFLEIANRIYGSPSLIEVNAAALADVGALVVKASGVPRVGTRRQDLR